MPLRDRNRVDRAFTCVVLGALSWIRRSLIQIDHTSAKKLIALQSWLLIPNIQYYRRSLINCQILMCEIECLIENRVKCLVDDICLKRFALEVPNLDVTVSQAVVVSCGQVPRLENKDANVRHVHTSGYLSRPAREFLKVNNSILRNIVQAYLDGYHTGVQIIID